MPGGPLTWVFQIIDRMSAPAGKMAHAVQSIERACHAGGEGLEFFALKAEAVIEIGERVVHTFERFGEGAYEFGKLGVEAAAFKENTLLALETILGSQKAAREVFEETEAFGNRSPFESKELLRLRSQLLTGGFNRSDSAVLLQAISDVGSLKGVDPGAMERFAQDLVRLQTTGKMTGREMTMLAGAGIKADDVFDVLGKKFGVTGGRARKMAEEGFIDSADAINAMLLVLQKAEGGAVGMVSARAANTITGLLARVRSRPEQLLSTLEGGASMNRFKGFLGNLADVLDPAKPFGRKIATKLGMVFDSGFSALFGNLTGSGGAAKLEHVFDSILTAGSSFAQGLFGSAAGGISQLLDKLASADPTAMKELGKAAMDFGRYVGDGVVALGKLAVLATDVIGPIAKGWGLISDIIHGNDKGLLETAKGSSGDLGGKIYDVVNARYPTLAELPGSKAYAAAHPTINVTVHAPGASKEDAHHIAKATGDSVAGALANHYEKTAIEGGAQ